jgi:hypothetical protein
LDEVASPFTQWNEELPRAIALSLVDRLGDVLYNCVQAISEG